MKQIKKQEELIGKTIAQIIIPKERWETMWIKFTDGSFVVFDTEDISTGFSGPFDIICIDEEDKDNTHEQLVELGLISPQMHTNALEERERRLEEEELERQVQEEMVIKEHELELLAKLKKKYPNIDKEI